jgi:hypothetical protein
LTLPMNNLIKLIPLLLPKSSMNRSFASQHFFNSKISSETFISLLAPSISSHPSVAYWPFEFAYQLFSFFVLACQIILFADEHIINLLLLFIEDVHLSQLLLQLFDDAFTSFSMLELNFF